MKRTAISVALAGIVLLAACEKKEIILTGERENIDAVLSEGNVETTLASNQAPAAAPPLRLPAR